MLITKGANMKSYVNTFTALYDALAEDIIAQYPSIKQDMEMDLLRLHKQLATTGLSFITISHLAMCDFFHEALAHEAIVDLPLQARPRGFGRKSSVDHRPKYLHGLMSMVFHEDGSLQSDPEVSAIAFVRQWLLMAKKMRITCNEDRQERALIDYLAVESQLPDHFGGTWDLDDPDFPRRTGHPLWGVLPERDSPDLFGESKGTSELPEPDWELYRFVCDRTSSAVGVLDPYSVRPKHGPGAVAEGPNEIKYDFSHWPRKLQQLFPWDYFATADLGYWRFANSLQPTERELPSFILCVPKTQKGPRIICKEPIAHQWIQGGIERFLVERIRSTDLRFSIDLHDQEPSKELALKASVDGSLATVDLSAASDRISTRLVEYVFQSGSSDRSVLEALHACRSRFYVLGNQHYKFRKFAPAGSACTFPVQSIIFTTIAASAIMQTRNYPRTGAGLKRALRSVRVFGDDIIVPTDSIPVLYRLLSECGLKVSTTKSFHTGLFRESCGMDAYAGVDVTPVYIRDVYSASKPTSLQSVVDASNNLHSKFLWRTANALLKTVPVADRKRLAVGYQDAGAVSLFSFCGRESAHLSKRWNDFLHRTEVQALVISSKMTKIHSDGDAALVQFFTEEPDPHNYYSSGQVRRVQSHKALGWASSKEEERK